MKTIVLAAALLVAPPVLAQSVDAPDPAKVTAARELIDVVMPPADRDALFETALKPMMANMERSILASPKFKEMIENDPKISAMVAAMLAKSNDRALTMLREGMPQMIEAMTRAYARRFSLAEMADAKAFFATPSGHAYMQKGMTIMADPDVQAWQTSLMQKAFAGVQTDVAEIIAELEKAGGQ